MRVALGSDHAGYDLKALLGLTLTGWGHEVVDFGSADSSTRVDYPDFGEAVGTSVASGQCDLGVAVCGSGIGISIAANKVPGVRAALVHDVTSARLAREHNHANVLCLGSRLTGESVAIDALEAWLGATPQERHQTRINKLHALESRVGQEERQF
jgi:ribose 5-phosphate isomerase B